MHEYERLKEALGAVSQEVTTMQNKVAQSMAQHGEQSQRIELLQEEKRELFQKCLQSEQSLSDKVRDGELKDIKIESLENIIQKREQTQLKNNAHNASTTSKKAAKDWSAKVDRLEQTKAKLEQEKLSLIEENQDLKQQLVGSESLKKVKEAREKQQEI